MPGLATQMRPITESEPSVKADERFLISVRASFSIVFLSFRRRIFEMLLRLCWYNRQMFADRGNQVLITLEGSLTIFNAQFIILSLPNFASKSTMKFRLSASV